MGKSIDPTQYLYNPPGPITDEEFQDMMNQPDKPADTPEWGYVDDLIFVFTCKECHHRTLHPNLDPKYGITENNPGQPSDKCEKCGYSGEEENILF